MVTEETKKSGILISPQIRRVWLKVRNSWNISHAAFSNTLSSISEPEANLLYDIVKLSLYKGSYAEILHEHKELKELLQSDEDRLCMHDIYEVLSWRLNKSEKLPGDLKLSLATKTGIGRGMPNFRQ
ncbi:hypothetical protein HZC07_03390 [Candidatus Micrarchaeota archaeon]|nr:hypothetical protein [Candidatus Micrarchaeota archaeon]